MLPLNTVNNIYEYYGIKFFFKDLKLRSEMFLYCKKK